MCSCCSTLCCFCMPCAAQLLLLRVRVPRRGVPQGGYCGGCPVGVLSLDSWQLLGLRFVFNCTVTLVVVGEAGSYTAAAASCCLCMLVQPGIGRALLCSSPYCIPANSMHAVLLWATTLHKCFYICGGGVHTARLLFSWQPAVVFEYAVRVTLPGWQVGQKVFGACCPASDARHHEEVYKAFFCKIQPAALCYSRVAQVSGSDQPGDLQDRPQAQIHREVGQSLS